MKNKIKIVSWNVNGYRSIVRKGFFDLLNQFDADIFALQEIRLQKNQVVKQMKFVNYYHVFFSFSSFKKGYSGVAVYTKIKPLVVYNCIGIPYFDNEGRVLQIDFGDFIFFNVYFPNGKMSGKRLIYKLAFYKSLFDYIELYRKLGRKIIVVGDFNTAHEEIDLKYPRSNFKISGFLSVEREWIDEIIKRGYVDTFRFLYPNTIKYSWWSYKFGARKNNSGWRIDYCFVSNCVIDNGWLKDAFVGIDIFGSDHCPVGIILNI